MKMPTHVKAMWICQFDLENVYKTEDGQQRDRADFTRLFRVMLDRVTAIGINTVILQMRPNADSMYPSAVYPPSAYVVGKYGREFTYDPVEIMLNEAHERGLAVHAWINPLRAMTAEEIEAIDDRYTLKKWWRDETLRARYLPVSEGRVYLNPAHAETRQLICDGAEELLRRYPVEGLHIDDYFYPTTDPAFDAADFAGSGAADLAVWRRENVNKVVHSLYETTKKVDPELPFGVSPAGPMGNNYNMLYADIYTWCGKPGYLDYVCPQIYFGLEHGTCAFEKLTRDWDHIIMPGIDMWVGMSLGKAVRGGEGRIDYLAVTEEGKTEWIRHHDVLRRCLEITPTFTRCRGVSYFCYHYFFDPLTGEQNPLSAEECSHFLPLLQEMKW